MSLGLLDTAKYKNPNVILICTKSNTMLNYVFDRVSEIYKHQTDSLIYINNTADLSVLKDMTNILPPFSDKWYVFTNVDIINPSNIIPWVYKTKETCFHIIFCENYGNYKKCLDSFVKSKSLNCLTFYLQYLNFKDWTYLLSKTKTTNSTELTPKLNSYICKNYYNNVESIWNLLNTINSGIEITSVKQIEQICGTPDIHTDEYIIKLLSIQWSNKPKGLKTQIRNQLKLGKNLGDTLGFDTFYNFLKASVKTLIDLKGLMFIDQVEIGKIKNEVNQKVFDIIKLRRFLKYYEDINSIPMSKILQFYSLLGKHKWTTDTEFFEFFYNWVSLQTKIQLT